MENMKEALKDYNEAHQRYEVCVNTEIYSSLQLLSVHDIVFEGPGSVHAKNVCIYADNVPFL